MNAYLCSPKELKASVPKYNTDGWVPTKALFRTRAVAIDFVVTKSDTGWALGEGFTNLCFSGRKRSKHKTTRPPALNTHACSELVFWGAKMVPFLLIALLSLVEAQIDSGMQPWYTTSYLSTLWWCHEKSCPTTEDTISTCHRDWLQQRDESVGGNVTTLDDEVWINLQSKQ